MKLTVKEAIKRTLKQYPLTIKYLGRRSDEAPVLKPELPTGAE